MLDKFELTGSAFLDAMIISQLVGIITNSVGMIFRTIYLFVGYIYNFIVGRLMITLILRDQVDNVMEYLDKLFKESEDNALFGNNTIIYDKTKNAKTWFEKIGFLPIDMTLDKFEMHSIMRKRVVFNGKYIWIAKYESIDNNKTNNYYKMMAVNWKVDKTFFKDFFIYLESRFKNKDIEKTQTINYRTYRTDMKKWWWISRPGRTFSSVYLNSDIKKDIIDDFHSFKSEKTKAFYFSHSIPYQRGWLLYGQPGTGKSSIVKALATEEKIPIYSIKLSDKYITDSTLESIILDVDNQSGIYLFEDIDVIFNNDRQIIEKDEPADEKIPKNDDEKKNKEDGKLKGGSLTYSGFINLLSGVNDLFNGCLIIMTTNHPERLPKSLIRPGRIDRAFNIGYADKDQIEQLLRSFHPNLSEGDYKLIPKMIIEKEQQLTIAILQNYFIRYRTADEIVANLHKIREV